MSATYQTEVIQSVGFPAWIDRLKAAIRRVFGHENRNLALEAIAVLSQPTPRILTVGIMADNPELVQLALGAGLEPTDRDLTLAVQPRCTARSGPDRTYQFRERVSHILRDRISGRPDLAEVVKKELVRIHTAAARGFINPVVVGTAAIVGLFPGIEVPKLPGKQPAREAQPILDNIPAAAIESRDSAEAERSPQHST